MVNANENESPSPAPAAPRTGEGEAPRVAFGPDGRLTISTRPHEWFIRGADGWQRYAHGRRYAVALFGDVLDALAAAEARAARLERERDAALRETVATGALLTEEHARVDGLTEALARVGRERDEARGVWKRIARALRDRWRAQFYSSVEDWARGCALEAQRLARLERVLRDTERGLAVVAETVTHVDGVQPAAMLARVRAALAPAPAPEGER